MINIVANEKVEVFIRVFEDENKNLVFSVNGYEEEQYSGVDSLQSAVIPVIREALYDIADGINGSTAGL